jgi:hypothetical protein
VSGAPGERPQEPMPGSKSGLSLLLGFIVVGPFP